MQKNVHWGVASAMLFRRMLLYMKLSLLFLVVALQVSATNFAQKRISLKANNLTVADILNQIEKTSSYRFSYSNDVLPSEMIVSINVVNANIDEVMSKIFEDYPLRWKTYKKTNVVISPVDEVVIMKPSAVAETVTGTILNEKGEPIAGASVTIKGSTIGTTTSADGTFSINANKGDVLIISSIGYTEQEVTVSDQPITIALTPIENKLDEVVVVGYGTMRKS
ncbi:MAG TPA: carboxypeptidase-like regulatory domain-containing protein, partial [Niabella sp.]|nr:carboxypeptidase-like regulatory domain-containing protein [Niabella sp.]